MTKLPEIFSRIFPLGKFNNIEEYFEHFIFQSNSSCLDKLLYKSQERRKWIGFYPNLKNFPCTEKYIQDEKAVNLSLVASELSGTNLFLPKDQVLFHQGNLPANLNVGSIFNLTSIFSTTLDPYIANCHEDNNTHWCIRVKNENVKCFPIPDKYGEYEVLILGSPRATIVDIKKQKRAIQWNGQDDQYNQDEHEIIYIDLI
ncbi:hypothetical protein [Actinobacillus pleuropneumoniae]|uniref:hypothetical protein n=1 Tax=Actinobacillus pleuropneumoniae TaxID=715 RepID=UPI003F7C28D9